MSRYNGEQPYGYYGGHGGYNPANDGWTHTGSNSQSKADFYQRDNVKMDYYPSTGTVKTSMDLPSQGPTQMFRKGLDSASFGNVCNKPRSHTGQGYQTKSSASYTGK
ncbi:hypothetical protein ABBQ32_001726 [Trebouxia sp. C0010 RCD-2024]